jgi:hypothetical protein
MPVAAGLGDGDDRGHADRGKHACGDSRHCDSLAGSQRRGSFDGCFGALGLLGGGGHDWAKEREQEQEREGELHLFHDRTSMDTNDNHPRAIE